MLISRNVLHRNGELIVHPVYSKEQADKKKMKYVYWKEVEPDNFTQNMLVLSDDSCVLEVVDVRNVYNRHVRAYKTWFGRFTLNLRHPEKSTMNVLPENKIHTDLVNGNKIIWSPALKRMVAHMMSRGLDRQEIINMLGLDSDSGAAVKIRKFSLTEECAEMVTDELRKVLNENSVDEDYVVKKYLTVLQLAEGDDEKAKPNLKMMLEVVREFAEMLQMKGTQTTTRKVEAIEANVKAKDAGRIQDLKDELRLRKLAKEEIIVNAK